MWEVTVRVVPVLVANHGSCASPGKRSLARSLASEGFERDARRSHRMNMSRSLYASFRCDMVTYVSLKQESFR